MNRKILGGILALTIGLSMYAVLTMAKPPVRKESVILGNYSGYLHSTSLGEDVVIMDTMIRTDKPAKFTVSIGASFLGDTGDTVTFHSEQNSGESSKTWVPTDVITADSNWKSFTYVGYGSFATYTDQNIVGMNIWWCIMVEGEEDTVVSFNPPF